jgi:YggT family protein
MNLYLTLLNTIRFAFWAYGILIFIRVISSWFPNLGKYRIIQMAYSLVDPYLNFFKRFIPPIGGVMDISPIVAFFALNLLEKLVLWVLF